MLQGADLPGAMLRSAVFLCTLSRAVYGEFEDLKKEIFTAESTGRWKGQADVHVPMLHLDEIKGGGWDATVHTTHVKQADHYIGKHWVEDGAGNVIFQVDFSPSDDSPLNMDKNQTSVFKVPKGTKEPLTTYAWCNTHGTWAHTWTGVQLWHFNEDVRYDEHGNEIKEEEEPEMEGFDYKQPHEVPVHAEVSAEDLKEFKTHVYTAEVPGQWKGKASTHVPDLEMFPVKGGGWVAELLTAHGKDQSHFISKHWIEDGKGKVLGVVDFDINDNGEHNVAEKQASKFHVPKDAAEPLTTYAYCNLHGTWAHTWTTLSLAHFSENDEL